MSKFCQAFYVTLLEPLNKLRIGETDEGFFVLQVDESPISTELRQVFLT